MFTLMSTDNYPDIMYPAATCRIEGSPRMVPLVTICYVFIANMVPLPSRPSHHAGWALASRLSSHHAPLHHRRLSSPSHPPRTPPTTHPLYHQVILSIFLTTYYSEFRRDQKQREKLLQIRERRTLVTLFMLLTKGARTKYTQRGAAYRSLREARLNIDQVPASRSRADPTLAGCH